MILQSKEPPKHVAKSLVISINIGDHQEVTELEEPITLKLGKMSNVRNILLNKVVIYYVAIYIIMQTCKGMHKKSTFSNN